MLVISAAYTGEGSMSSRTRGPSGRIIGLGASAPAPAMEVIVVDAAAEGSVPSKKRQRRETGDTNPEEKQTAKQKRLEQVSVPLPHFTAPSAIMRTAPPTHTAPPSLYSHMWLAVNFRSGRLPSHSKQFQEGRRVQPLRHRGLP